MSDKPTTIIRPWHPGQPRPQPEKKTRRPHNITTCRTCRERHLENVAIDFPDRRANPQHGGGKVLSAPVGA